MSFILSDAESKVVVTVVRNTLRGAMPQSAFAESLGIATKSFERMLSGKHRLRRDSAVLIAKGLAKKVPGKKLSYEKRKAVADLRISLIFWLDSASIAAGRALLQQGFVAIDDLPDVVFTIWGSRLHDVEEQSE